MQNSWRRILSLVALLSVPSTHADDFITVAVSPHGRYALEVANTGGEPPDHSYYRVRDRDALPDAQTPPTVEVRTTRYIGPTRYQMDEAPGTEIVPPALALHDGQPILMGGSAAVSDDGQRVLLTLDDGTIQVRGPDGAVIYTFPGETTAAALSADGQRLVLAQGNDVGILDLGSKLGGTHLPVSIRVASIAISPDGKTVVAGGYDKKAVLIQEPFTHAVTSRAGNATITGVGVSTQGVLAAVEFGVTRDRKATALLQILHPDKREAQVRIPQSPGLNHLKFLSDGRVLVSSYVTGVVHVVDPSESEPKATEVLIPHKRGMKPRHRLAHAVEFLELESGIDRAEKDQEAPLPPEQKKNRRRKRGSKRYPRKTPSWWTKTPILPPLLTRRVDG